MKEQRDERAIESGGQDNDSIGGIEDSKIQA
jgi:hypothetical protein